MTGAPAPTGKPGLWVHSDEMLASDEEQQRTVGLLLLGKGAVLAHGVDRPLAAESDEFR